MLFSSLESEKSLLINILEHSGATNLNSAHSRKQLQAYEYHYYETHDHLKNTSQYLRASLKSWMQQLTSTRGDKKLAS